MPIDVILERTGETVTLGSVLASGSEGAVHRILSDPDMLVKLARRVTPEYEAKIGAMHAAGEATVKTSDDIQICWLRGRVKSVTGGLMGIEIPFASGKQPVSVVYETDPAKRWVQADYPFRLEVARRLALVFDAAESHSCVIGDVGPGNFLVGRDRSLAAVDVDSWQIAHGGQTYRSNVATPDFVAPELIGVSLPDVDREPSSHRWSLAVLNWLLLVGPGSHPFAARAVSRRRGKQPALIERIQLGIWPYAQPAPRGYRPRTAAPFDLLHPLMQQLMVECFQNGHSDPSQRPTPSQWFHAISQVQADQTFLQDVQQLELQAVKRQLRTVSVPRRLVRRVPRIPGRPFWVGLACSAAIAAALAGAYGLGMWRTSTSPSPWEVPEEYGEGKPTPELWTEWANED